MSWRATCLAAALLAAVAAPVGARPIHYGAVADASLAACDEHAWHGRRDEAVSCFRAVYAGAAGDAVRAEAAWALGDLHAANRLFRDALAAGPGDAAVLTRWADLYADTHQDAEAMNIYREALAADPGHAYAKLGAARVLTNAFDEAAEEYLEPLLDDAAQPAGARVGAWLLLARIALEDGNTREAGAALDAADALIAAHGWPPLELYALRAAADLVGNATSGPWIERSLAYNPHYGDIYAVPAHFRVIARRYREAIALYQQAVQVDPALARAHEELGVNLLRDNQTTLARQHLELAHEADPFSPVAVNTLRLLDSYSNFELVTEPGAAGRHPLVLRLHRQEAAAIAPYATELAQSAIRTFGDRYGYRLREPVIVEMYPDHEDFAVRTAGMPGIGILGATFGYVIAMDSPSSRSTDEFQWGTTLWHELAHVFTLEATDHLVPRWFSEGISVFEEWHSGPHRGVHLPVPVLAAMHEGRFLPVATLDQGFMRPTYANQVIVSYMQAGLVCYFIDRRYGSDRLAALLPAFRDGLDTAAAIRRVLGIDAPKFDREFERWVDGEYGALLAALGDRTTTQSALARAMADEKWDDAERLAEQLVAQYPGYVEPDSPYLALARARDERGDGAAATAALREFWSRGGFDPVALKGLAARLAAAGDAAAAIDVLATVTLVQPLDASLHGTLGDLRLDSGDAAGALQEYQVLLALDPHDKADAYFRIARAYRGIGNIDESRRNLLAALDIAPGYRPAQRLLLELMRPGRDQ